jgi:hypothetical protein
MEAVCSSEMLVPTYKFTQHHNQDDRNGQLGSVTRDCQSVKFILKF